MAQKSGFFNAVRDEYGNLTPKYNAKDYSDNLAVIIGNGVMRSENDDLKVTAAGMVATVAAGRGWINGHYYLNDSPLTFIIPTAPIGGKRYDRIMLRLDETTLPNDIHLVYVEGTAANVPTKPAKGENDLVLCDIFIDTNATSVTLTDTRADKTVCGWVYSTSGDDSFFTSLDNSFWTWFNQTRDTLASVTLFKRYTQNITVASATSAVAFNIPQYDPETCFVEVYVNGIFDNRHTVNNNIITFVGTLTAGTLVTVNAYKSIDGTGIMTVSDEITELQQQFATLDGISKFTYKCTGLNDNIALSQIAQAILDGSYTVGSLSTAAEAFLTAIGGNTYLSSMPTDAHLTITVSGVLGATTPHAGSGTAENRYKWFSFGKTSGSDRKLTFDFSKCPKIEITCSANSSNIIFFGTDLNIKNANVIARSQASNCAITMGIGTSALGVLNFDDCNFIILTTGKAVISDSGNFTNCNLHVKSSSDNAYCIDGKDEGLARINCCTCFAYTGTSSKIAAVFNIESTQPNAVIMASMLNCPTVAQSGYWQQYLARSNGGKIQIDNVVSTMDCTGNATYRSVTGQIWKSKH